MSASSDTNSKWLKISLFTPNVLSEAASDLMGILSGSGVEQSLADEKGCTITGFFSLAGEEPIDKSIEECKGSVTQKMNELFALYEQPQVSLEVEVIDDQDWSNSWKQYFNTFEIAPGLVLKPSWEEYTPEPGQQVIEMDPGMAFGTGQHASTRMALSLLAESLKNKDADTALDVGTGTGILAIAGALLGVQSVKAIDNDPDAVTAAVENVAGNNLSEKVVVGDEPLDTLQGEYDIICANIIHDVLVEMAPDFKRLIKDKGVLVLAGILAGEQEENIIQVYKKLGFSLIKSEHTDEWAALLLEYTTA